MQSFEEINNLTKDFLQGVHGLRAVAAISVVIFERPIEIWRKKLRVNLRNQKTY